MSGTRAQQAGLPPSCRVRRVGARSTALGLVPVVCGVAYGPRRIGWRSCPVSLPAAVRVPIQGFRIATGQSRDSMMALVVNAAKATFIVSAALALGVSGTYWNKLLGTDMPAAITHLVTDDPDSSAEEQIDESLAWMQVAFKAIDAVDVAGDQVVNDEKSRALLLTAIGSGGPAVVAGAMLMLYQVAIAFSWVWARCPSCACCLTRPSSCSVVGCSMGSGRCSQWRCWRRW